MNINELWDNIVNYGIATDEEVRLVVDLLGYSIETLNNILFARTGYRNWEQYLGEY